MGPMHELLAPPPCKSPSYPFDLPTALLECPSPMLPPLCHPYATPIFMTGFLINGLSAPKKIAGGASLPKR